MAWSNILSNEHFGAVTTDSIGGFTWYENSRTNRISKFDNDAYFDSKSERLIINSKVFGNFENTFKTTFGFGYSQYEGTIDKLKIKEMIFVPIKDNCKIMIIKIKNVSKTLKAVNLRYEVDWQLGEKESDSRLVCCKYKKVYNMLISKSCKKSDYISFLTSSENLDENVNVKINIEADKSKTLVFILGATANEESAIKVAVKMIDNYERELKNTKKYWMDKVSMIKSKTPDKTFDFMQNGWLAYQTIVSRLYGKTGYYQSSGGYGFRDQLQDCLAMKFVDANMLKNQILKCCEHQFYEGDVEHWWHDDSKLGIRTRYSDDMLWLPYAVIEYVEFTGDYEILNTTEKYLDAKILETDEIDRVDVYSTYKDEESVFNHCIKAIERSLKFGCNGLPLIKGGDWNDGMNKVGIKGRGESVWLGFFMYDIMNRFLPIIKYEEKHLQENSNSKEIAVCLNEIKGKPIKKAEFINDTNISYIKDFELIIKDAMIKLKENLNANAWDGKWYVRAFDDNNNKIGSHISEECKIDSIPQSWSIISDAGDYEKSELALSNAKKELIDNEHKIVKLLTPPLEKIDLGYITNYERGVRENGGQYTHAAIWLLIAQIIKKDKDAFLTYKCINPIEHSKNKDFVKVYKVEPYSIAADICCNTEFYGRGGWTWYTGSSGWLYKCQIENILGIKIRNNELSIEPFIPKEWNEFEVTLKWKKAIYNIKYIKNFKYGKINRNEKVILKNVGKFNIDVFF